MFARTERLLLRPGWAEDAPALADAIADEAIVRNLASAPWPYSLADAEAFLATQREAAAPCFLIFRRTLGPPQLAGTIGIGRKPNGALELGYWIARHHWGRGYATEALSAALAHARSLGVGHAVAETFLDNAASQRVLAKAGFAPGGIREREVPTRRGPQRLRQFGRPL